MDQLIEVLKRTDLVTIFTIIISGWFFYNRLNTKIEKENEKLEGRIGKLEEKMGDVQTKIAVMESRINDISTNVTHLMWQNQLPHREAQEK